MTDTNIRLQNLRDFTVQIRRADTDAILGTGIAVSTDGKIVTCAHVVRAAGIDPRKADGAEIGVYFPQTRGGEEKKRRATVNCCFREYDDCPFAEMVLTFFNFRPVVCRWPLTSQATQGYESVKLSVV